MNRRRLGYLAVAVLVFLLTGCFGGGGEENSHEEALPSSAPASAAEVPTTQETPEQEPVPSNTSASATPTSAPHLTLVVWEDNPEEYLEAVANHVMGGAQRRDPKLGDSIPEVRLVQLDNPGIRCSSRPGLVIAGNDGTAPVIWCNASTAQKLYAGEEALRVAAGVSQQRVLMLVMYGLGEYTAAQYELKASPAASACATGYLVQHLKLDGVLTDETAMGLRPDLPDPNHGDSFRNGYYNGIEACKIAA